MIDAKELIEHYIKRVHIEQINRQIVGQEIVIQEIVIQEIIRQDVPRITVSTSDECAVAFGLSIVASHRKYLGLAASDAGRDG